jgi:glycogen operon protein
MELLLFEKADSTEPYQIIPLDPQHNRSFFFWHVYVEGLAAGAHYAWRVHGPSNTSATGLRFDSSIELLDPWAKAITDVRWDRAKALLPNERCNTSMRAMVVDIKDYDWEGDLPINHKIKDSILYELHVRGFTRHPSAEAEHPGTFAGLIEKIPYLLELGISDVELMPIMAFDRQDVPPGVAALGNTNYWGYSTHSFYSVHPHYCASPLSSQQLNEFRDLIKALHKANIGVILDVVFNHTAEAGADGPVINMKGFFNEFVYHLDPDDLSLYRDYTGCGNTVNCNHPVVTKFIVSCLEYWVRELHVDGFRFDLASTMVRAEDGTPMHHAPLPWNIEFSDRLSATKLIAEAWDAAGLYQVGGFPGYRWSEWNGRYRDVIRRFVRGDKGILGDVSTCITGSSDLYQEQGRQPTNSINFITCHDGFTLNDLVSYKHKHNEANGEENRDGHNENLSWNCGVDGPTDDPDILSFRQQQVKNFFAILLLSQGVPMILAGDEVLRSQCGNNNDYCQDNETNWLDWDLMRKNSHMLRFVQQLIAFRKRHACLRRSYFFTGTRHPDTELPDICWHGYQLHKPLWDDPDAQLLAYTLSADNDDEAHLHIIYNMADSSFDLPLPKIQGHTWYRVIDTAEPSPQDIQPAGDAVLINDEKHVIRQHSIVVFEGRTVAG